MKQKNTIYIILVSFLLSSSTCRKENVCPDNSHTTIAIVNNSGIQVNWMKDDKPNDTIWTVNGAYPGTLDRLISPNSVSNVGAGLDYCWEYSYQHNYSNYFFIFSHDTVQAIGWQAIDGTNRGLLKRIKVDLNYLQTNNFTITYP